MSRFNHRVRGERKARFKAEGRVSDREERRAEREANGGYRLDRDAGTISLLEVVESAEGPLINTRCTLRGGACRPHGRCAVHNSWTAAGEAFRQRLRGATLADLVG